ncbi:ParE family toxin-like protein [Lelliottia wanjuensis]
MKIVNADSRRFGKKIITKALYCLHRHKAIRLKHHKREHEITLYKVECGYSHRLISSDCENWQLLTHEEYSSRLFNR